MKRLYQSLLFKGSTILLCAFAGISAIYPPTVAELLTQSAWTSMESWKDKDGDGVFVFDMADCHADDNWQFGTDGICEMTEDSVVCEPDLTFLDTVSCNWLLENGETLLNLYFPDSQESLEFQIVADGEHELILHFIDPDYPADAVREKVILRR